MAKKEVKKSIKDSILALSKRTIPLDIRGEDGVHHLFIHRPGAEVMLTLKEGDDWIKHFGSKCIKDTEGNDVFSIEDLTEIEKSDALTFNEIRGKLMSLIAPQLSEFETKNFPDSHS